MKLSEMNTRQLAAALCRLTAPMSRIATDENINGVFGKIADRMKRRAHMSEMEKMGMLMDVVPMLLESHYADTIEIVSIMTGKSVPEVEAQNGFAMIDEIRKCLDSQFFGFFRSSAAMAQTGKAEGE